MPTTSPSTFDPIRRRKAEDVNEAGDNLMHRITLMHRIPPTTPNTLNGKVATESDARANASTFAYDGFDRLHLHQATYADGTFEPSTITTRSASWARSPPRAAVCTG